MKLIFFNKTFLFVKRNTFARTWHLPNRSWWNWAHPSPTSTCPTNHTSLLESLHAWDGASFPAKQKTCSFHCKNGRSIDDIPQSILHSHQKNFLTENPTEMRTLDLFTEENPRFKIWITWPPCQICCQSSPLLPRILPKMFDLLPPQLTKNGVVHFPVSGQRTNYPKAKALKRWSQLTKMMTFCSTKLNRTTTIPWPWRTTGTSSQQRREWFPTWWGNTSEPTKRESSIIITNIKFFCHNFWWRVMPLWQKFNFKNIL